MGFVDSVFGGQEQIKFETNPQSKDAKFAREQIRKKAEEGFGDVPLRGIAELPGQTEERQLA
ncbi:MAG: hypothetical protein KAJ19_26880, partial [Gammaproteobacteria bacterium]|nr:hypothetical protein [Gammaproteobacteria bacterium]